MPDIKRILFAQSPGVIDQQRAIVERFIAETLGVIVEFASTPGDVAPGEAYDVVIAPTVPWLPELLARVRGVRWVHFLSAGVEKIWSMDVAWSSVAMTKSSGVHAVPMSEYAIGAMLYFAKGFDRFADQSRRSTWQRAWLDELAERELVILGLGSVGSAVAEHAQRFGMNVSGVAKTRRATAGVAQVVSLDRLPDLLARADYVVVSLPLTAQTAGLVGQQFFTALKPGAVLVDMSRGGIVSSDALIAALDDGTLRGAALDVFEKEPLPAESPLWNRSNVLLTPHVAGTTPHYIAHALEIFLENAQRYLSGEEFITPVDVSLGY